MKYSSTVTVRYMLLLILTLLLVLPVASWSQTTTQPPTTIAPPPTTITPPTPPTTMPSPTVPPFTMPGMPLPPTVTLPGQPMPLPPGVAPPTAPGPAPTVAPPAAPVVTPAPAPVTPVTPTDPFTVTLPIFGHNLFSNVSTSALPPQSAPVSDAYVLGPGDIVSIRLSTAGNLQVSGDVAVDPEGNLYLDNIGRVGVQGLSLAAVRALLRTRYGRLYRDFNLEVTISQMRTVDVFVIGEVAQPGKYTLPGNATVFTALFAAGGPTATGSLRNVQLTRADKTMQKIDFYDYLLQGQRVVDIPLQPGDTLFVPVVGPLVGIAGDVKRPAQYELKGPTSLAQVLAMAGGLQAVAYAPRLEVRRYSANASFQTMDVDLAKPGVANSFFLQDGDRVVADDVTDLLVNGVELDGQVYRPGVYQLRPGLTLGALLHDAQGFQPTAYPSWGTLLRLDPQTGQYENLIINPIAAWQGQAGQDIPLQAQDKVMIYARTDVVGNLTVNVQGHVRNPQAVPYVAGMTIKDAILLAGGLLPEALTSRALLLRVRPDMSREVLTVSVAQAMAGDPTQNLTLLPYDQLTIFAQTDIGPLPQVTIGGQVNNTGSYPRRQDMTVSQLIEAAGGILPGADGIIQVTHGRYTDHPQVETAKFTVGPSLPTVTPDLVLQDDDFVAVMGSPDYIQQPLIAQVLGQVATPGPYVLENPSLHPEGVWDLIKRSGGLLSNAYGPGIVVYRKSSSLMNVNQQGQYTHVITNLDQQQRELHLEPATLPPAGSNVIGAAAPPLAAALSGPQATAPTTPPAPIPAPTTTPISGAPTTAAPTTTTAPTGTTSSPSTTTPTTPTTLPITGAYVPNNLQPLPGLNVPTGPGGVAGMTAPAPVTPTVTPGTVNSGVLPASGAVPALPGATASALQQITLGMAQAFTTQNAVMIAVPPRDLTTTTFSSAIPIDWKRVEATHGKQGDVVLLDGDVVYIPTTPTLVLVAGAVQNQGPIRYQPGMRVADAINQGGGLGKDAVLRSAIVIHANGETVHVGPRDVVQPGDIIIVPTQYIIQKAHDQSALERILSSLANAALFFRLF